MDINTFARKLHELEVVKFGRFTLKSGMISPFYLDLRQILKDPAFMDQVAAALDEKARNLSFDVVAGIPYTAVPLAALMAVKMDKPLIIPRKEKKTYGTGGNIMGHFSPGDRRSCHVRPHRCAAACGTRRARCWPAPCSGWAW